jgi:hypothetical protein
MTKLQLAQIRAWMDTIDNAIDESSIIEDDARTTTLEDEDDVEYGRDVLDWHEKLVPALLHIQHLTDDVRDHLDDYPER